MDQVARTLLGLLLLAAVACVVDRLAILNAADPRKLSQGLHHPGQLRKSWYFFFFFFFFFFALPELPESVVRADHGISSGTFCGRCSDAPGAGYSRGQDHPPVAGLTRFDTGVRPNSDDQVEVTRHHARARPGSGRGRLAGSGAAAPAPGRDSSVGLSPSREPDRLCFRGILIRLVTGASWVDIEAILDHQVSDTTLRACRDEWIDAGVFEQVHTEALGGVRPDHRRRRDHRRPPARQSQEGSSPPTCPELCRTGGVVTSDAADTSTIAVALGSAAAAFAVPAALGVAQPLPAVQSEPTAPGRGHGGLLGGEPGRLAEGDPEGNDPGQDSAGVVALLGRGHAVQLGQELLPIPPAMLRRQGQRG
jgi:hypothetical protein